MRYPLFWVKMSHRWNHLCILPLKSIAPVSELQPLFSLKCIRAGPINSFFFSLYKYIYKLILSQSQHPGTCAAPHCRPFQNNNAFHNNSKLCVFHSLFCVIPKWLFRGPLVSAVRNARPRVLLTAKHCNRNLNGNRKKQQLLNETPNDVNRKNLIKRISSDA